MKKKARFVGNCPSEVLNGVFVNWTEQAANLSVAYPDDQLLDQALEALANAFDAVVRIHSRRQHSIVIVGAQSPLPDYETDDLEFGDAPF